MKVKEIEENIGKKKLLMSANLNKITMLLIEIKKQKQIKIQEIIRPNHSIIKKNNHKIRVSKIIKMEKLVKRDNPIEIQDIMIKNKIKKQLIHKNI